MTAQVQPQPHMIEYGEFGWNSNSGELPYDYALRHAWLDMMQELYGEDANFLQFFQNVPPHMFVTSSTTKPVLSDIMATGHLDSNERLFLSVIAVVQERLDPNSNQLRRYHTQTIVTLTLDKAPSDNSDHFSTVVFNSAGSINSPFQSVYSHGSSSIFQRGFSLYDQEEERLFRDSVMPGKLASHPLLKFYRI